MKEELYSYFANEATPEQVERIERWLEEDAAHRREFDRAHMLFNALTLHRDALGEVSAPARGRVLPLGRAIRTIGRVAAVAALVAVGGYAGGRIEQGHMERRMAASMQAVEVPAGHRMELTLADGTSVCLNGGSRLEYPLLFARDCRCVKLSGEAFFRVTHDERHPFAVETYASRIEVLGTEFDVVADKEHGLFSTTLIDGSVRVSCPGDGQQVVLRPDEMVRLVDGRLTLSQVDGDEAICWTEGYINVSGVAFDELMHRFERAYGVKIRLERSDLPRVEYASGKIRISEGVDFALRLLQLACDFTYSRDEETNTIHIR